MVVCLAGASAIRFSGLSDRELWLDEVCTHYCVKHWDAWPADGPDREREVTHRAYFGLLRGWAALAGNEAWGLRSFSAVAGVATVGILGLVTAGLVGRGAGLVAAGLAAVHPLHVHYSQEARAYSLWCLVVTLLLLVLFRAARTLRWRWWVAYAGLAWFTLAIHDYSVFFLPATAAGVLVANDRARFFRQWAAVSGVVGLLIAPTMLGFLRSQIGGGSKAWIAREWAGYPPWTAAARSVWAMLPSGGYPRILGSLASVTSYGSIVLTLGLMIWTLVRRSWVGGGRVGAAAGLVSLGFLATAWVFSATFHPAYVVGRYDLAAWAGVMIGLATLIVSAGRAVGGRRAGLVATGLVTATFVSGSLLTLQAVRTVPATQDLAKRSRRLAAVVEDGDLLVCVAMYKWFLLYEWDRIGFHPHAVSFPSEHDRQLGWEDGASELKRPESITRSVAAIGELAAAALERGQRVWLIARGKPEGTRWEVDRQLFGGLTARGFTVEPVDEWLGLARVERKAK